MNDLGETTKVNQWGTAHRGLRVVALGALATVLLLAGNTSAATSSPNDKGSGILGAAAPTGTTDASAPVTGFQDNTVFSGLTAPTQLRFASDGRIFVAEKSGLIKEFDNLADTTPTVFADLRTNVDNYWDRGLLGMALDPGFTTGRPYVYVLYTFDAPIGGTAPVWNDACPTPPGPSTNGCVVSGRLSRLTANGNVQSGPEQVLINDWCQQFPSHSIGTLVFGSDGALYVSGGDGASFNFVDYGQVGNPCGDPPSPVGTNLAPPTAEGGALRSQDLRTSSDPASLSGSILRLNPDTGAAATGNPNGASSDPNARRIVAQGLRNPFRFTFRPGTNEVWIGDVGWNDWEEINRLTNPTASVGNFGWPCYEGPGVQAAYQGTGLTLCTNLYNAGSGAVISPYYAYTHNGQVVSGESCPVGSSSISGLAFYQGGNYPSSYNGALFFADYSRKCIWVMMPGSNGLPNPNAIASFDPGALGPVDLQIGPGGDLFYADYDTGTIRRIQYTGGGSSGTPPGTSYLSDLSWTSGTSGYGPIEKDTSNGGFAGGDGVTITLNGTTYAKGLGVHAASDISYALAGTCSRFKASVGVDDEVGANGSVVFQVFADATKVYDSGTMFGPTATKTIDVAIANAQTLRLVVTDGGDGIASDHADWALARIDCGSADTTPPTVTGQTPAPGATGVALSVNPTATFSEGMDPSTLTTSTFTLVKQGTSTPLAASVSYDGTSRTATLAPTSALVASTTYTATVKGGASGAKDSAGNALATDVGWSFTTGSGGSDTTPPTVTGQTPAPGTTGVALSVNPTATFSEGMDPSTLTTNTFTLVKQGTSTPLAASVSYDGTSRTATLAPTSALVASTTYTATVKGGASGAKDSAGNALAADVGWSFTTGATGTTSTYLSDLSWTSGTSGYGPIEKDTSNGGFAGGDGVTITLNGTTYAKGLGVHAASDISYTVGGTCSRFKASVGVDDEVGANGSVVFQVFADATKVYDSATMTGATATKTIDVAIANAQTLRLVVTDGGDGIASDHADWALARIECSGSANTPPSATIQSPSSNLTWRVGDAISFSGSATDAQDGNLPASALSWTLAIEHCPSNCHEHIIQTWSGVASGSFNAPDHEYPSYLQLRLTATDSQGAATTKSVDLQPVTVNLTFNSAPSGLQLSAGSTTGAAPFTKTVIRGSSNSISAPSPQMLSGTTYTFSSWSDGGAATHNVVANAAATYTATYTNSGGSDTTPPTVTGPTPAPGATGVALSVTPTATFSESINSSTLTTSTFTLVKQGTSTPLAASVSYNDPTRTATLTPSAALQASTTYTATVKGGSSGVKDLAGNALAADVSWSFTTGSGGGGSPPPPGTSYLSDLSWTSGTSGYGPIEKDTSNGGFAGGDGVTITLNGTTYAKGLGVHAASDISYALAGTCSRFKASVGVDDEVGANGSVVFQVFADATKVYDSATMTGATVTKTIDVAIANAQTLRLVVTDAGNGINSDHADWALARIDCGSADTTPPTVTGQTPAPGATGVALSVNPTATFSEGMDPSTLTTSTFTLVKQGTSTPLAASVSYDGTSRTATLAPTSALVASTTYTATVKGGASGAKDSAGNALATDVGWSFTTGSGGSDTTPPTVTGQTPAPGTTGVALSVNPTATFSEGMDPSTLTTNTFTLVKQGTSTPLAASVSYDGTSRTATLAPTSALVASTTYTATVKGGASGAKDSAGNALAADVGWSFTTGATGTTSTYLSDLSWTSGTSGYGPIEKDTSNGGFAGGDGVTITLNGTTYAKGLGVHAASDISYTVGGTCSRFKASVGVDDEVGANGSVVFQVFADATKVYDSATMTGATATKTIDVAIANAQTLRLVVTDGGDGIASDHADWADARIEC